jgi:diaminopimelate epimerase
MKIHFTKMHGLGNDFILIECLEHDCKFAPPLPPLGREGYASQYSGLAQQLCHRRFCIGADQLLLLYPSRIADYKMRIFNADGSEVEMCGNGIRCLAKYVWDRNISRKKILKIETLAGIMRPEKAGQMVKVDMGEPIFEPEKIPVKVQKLKVRRKTPPSRLPPGKTYPLNPPLGKGEAGGVIDYPLKIEKKTFKITCVSMGNPHTVIVLKDISYFPVAHYGPLIENHTIFPKRTNVEFIEVLNPSEITMRVWERGSGETMACGTGASAVAVASHMKGLTGRAATVHLRGGDLLIEWAPDNHVYMTGPAEKTFEGTIEI